MLRFKLQILRKQALTASTREGQPISTEVREFFFNICSIILFRLKIDMPISSQLDEGRSNDSILHREEAVNCDAC